MPQIMIKLERPNCPNPAALSTNYRDPQCKASLQAASYGKCAYCESKVSHVYWGDIEHIRPKAKFPALEFEWSNLGYVCAKCNNAKSDVWSELTPLIDPYVDDPSEHLCALGAALHQKNGSERGELTIRTADLNRGGLLEQRKKRMDQIIALVDRAKRTVSPEIAAALNEELVKEIGDDREYAIVAQTAYKTLTAK